MTWTPHITVAAVACDNDRFLLVDEWANGERVLNQPAGHLDPGETLVEAVVRETLEETGWHFQPDYLVGLYLWSTPSGEDTFLRATYFGQCLRRERNPDLDDGIVEATWLSLAEMQQSTRLRSPLVLRSVEDYLAGKRLPLATVTAVGMEPT